MYGYCDISNKSFHIVVVDVAKDISEANIFDNCHGFEEFIDSNKLEDGNIVIAIYKGLCTEGLSDKCK